MLQRNDTSRATKAPSSELTNGIGRQRPALMTVEELAQATCNFSSLNIIGTGGFGSVYRAMVKLRPVAIKVMDENGLQGQKEYENELELLARLRHACIVGLVGYTAADSLKKCIVYELMPNGNLEERLFNKKEHLSPLHWTVRLRIACQIAAGLDYLHQQKPPICHRDLKPANVLLDCEQNAKLGDVGLSKMVVDGGNMASLRSTTLVGDFDYLDPHYMGTGVFTLASDVYALGLIFMMLLAGKPARGLAEKFRTAIATIDKGDRSSRFTQLLDRAAGVWDERAALRLARIAIWCCKSDPKDRPSSLAVHRLLKDATQNVVPIVIWSGDESLL